MKVQPRNAHYFVVAVEEDNKVKHVLRNVHNKDVATNMTYEQAHLLCKVMEQTYAPKKVT